VFICFVCLLSQNLLSFINDNVISIPFRYIRYIDIYTEMGLGKTIQCVALIAHLLTKDVSGPFLIVAPLATLPNWVREFEKWLPSHPVVRYHGPQPVREALLKGVLHPKLKRDKKFPFIVTSYEVAIRDQSKLEKLSEFTYLIVDEGHRLKNHRCLLLNSLKKLKCANRLLLTGYVFVYILLLR
jgi:ATP-dependent DNA helicase